MDNALFPAEALPLFRPYSYKCMYCGRGGAKSWAAARLSSSRVAASYSSLALVKLKTPRVLAKPADGQGWSCGSGWWIAPKVGGGILVCLRLPLGGQLYWLALLVNGQSGPAVEPLPGQLWGLKGLSWQSSIHLITLRPGKTLIPLAEIPQKMLFCKDLGPKKA